MDQIAVAFYVRRDLLRYVLQLLQSFLSGLFSFENQTSNGFLLPGEGNGHVDGVYLNREEPTGLITRSLHCDDNHTHILYYF